MPPRPRRLPLAIRQINRRWRERLAAERERAAAPPPAPMSEVSEAERRASSLAESRRLYGDPTFQPPTWRPEYAGIVWD